MRMMLTFCFVLCVAMAVWNAVGLIDDHRRDRDARMAACNAQRLVDLIRADLRFRISANERLIDADPASIGNDERLASIEFYRLKIRALPSFVRRPCPS